MQKRQVKHSWLFKDRFEAGELLAESLLKLKLKTEDLIVIGLARGGLPVAAVLADKLKAPLDVLVVRKLGVPWQPELALGAIATDGIRILNHKIIAGCKLFADEIQKIELRERIEIERRSRAYRKTRPALELNNKTVILTDDGLATGATMKAAMEWTRQKRAKKIIVAVPVADKDTCREFEKKEYCEHCICSAMPEFLNCVGCWYEDFTQVSEQTVISLLSRESDVFLRCREF